MKTKVVIKSAKDGEFKSKAYKKKHESTTYFQVVPVGKKAKPAK